MDEPYPSGPRILAGLGALVMGAYFGVLSPLSQLEAGNPLTAIAMVVATLPLVAFLGLLAAAPDALQRILRPISKIDLRDGGHVAAAVTMAGTLFFVLGFGALASGVNAYETHVVHGEPMGPVDGNALFAGLVLNLIILVIPVFFYVSFVHGKGPAATFDALGIRSEGAASAILQGFAVAVGFILLLVIASAVVMGFEVEVPENEQALAIAKSVTVLGAFGIAVGSSVSEEIFFRGFLQPRIGMFGQAAVFALAHLSYVNVLEVVITFALALAFGYMYRRSGNLLAPIAAHFLFNLIMLVAGVYAPEPA